MLDICNAQDRKCQGAGCTRMPNFNFPGEKGGIFCAQHKSEGMVDIKHKRCQEPGCSKRPSFNYTGEQLQASPLWSAPRCALPPGMQPSNTSAAWASCNKRRSFQAHR